MTSHDAIHVSKHSETDVRQGITLGVMRYVLAASLAFAVVALSIVGVVFAL